MIGLEQWLRQPQTVWLRRAIFQIHLWSGLAVGAYVILICVTGSVLIYRTELQAYFEPQPRYVDVSGPRMSDEALTGAAVREFPDHTVNRIITREDPTRAATITLDREGARSQMLFDPYTGDWLGHRLSVGYRLTLWMLDFHDHLLYEAPGRRVNGVGSIILTLLAFTGAVIWWPGTRTWRKSLSIDWRANWRRLNWSLHSAMGAWFFLFVLMWAITGIYLTIPEPFDAVADAIEPYDEESFDPRGVDTVLYWIAQVHFGRFGGAATKIPWFIIGLVPPILFVTGVIMWWNRTVRRWLGVEPERTASL